MLVPAIDTLRSVVSHNQSWLDGATLVVFTGLLGEILTTFLCTKDKPRSEITLEVVCALVIAIGVLGEWKFGSDTAQANAQLVALLNKEAGEANERAAMANEKAESENLARIKLEEAYAPRRIQGKQRALLASQMARFPGETVTIWFHAGDREGQVFATDLWYLLNAAHCNVYAPASIIDLAQSVQRSPPAVQTGVTISSTQDAVSVSAARALVAALNGSGFNARRRHKFERRPVPLVVVTVESRPEGLQG